MTDATLLLERFAVALCVWREARGESLWGKRLVAQVIENRIKDQRWPDTYVGVITQPSQFSSFSPADPNAVLFPTETDPAWPSCVAAADAVMQAADPFTHANHYCTIGVHPPWRDDTKMSDREGAHVFFTL